MVKKNVKKGRVSGKSSRITDNNNVNRKLDRILSAESRLLKIEKEVESKEEKLMSEEKRIEKKEAKIESESEDIRSIKEELIREDSDIDKLEKIEEEIKKEVGEHPLAQVTLKDISKGLIGAFVGLAIHYTFTYGVEISKELTMTRATVLFPVTFLVGLLFIYATGFRKIEDKKLLLYMPLRLGVLYICSLIMSIAVLFLFYPEFGHIFEESYKMVAGVMLAAVVGACTADLLGKE